MLIHPVPIFLKMKLTHKYMLHNNCYIKSSVMYATLLQNKCFSNIFFLVFSTLLQIFWHTILHQFSCIKLSEITLVCLIVVPSAHVQQLCF